MPFLPPNQQRQSTEGISQQGHAGSKTLYQQNPPVLNWRCQLTHVDLYDVRQTVGVVCWSDDLSILLMQGKASGVDRRVHGSRIFVAAEELPRVGHARHRLHYFHRRSDVRPRHKTRPTRAQEQIKSRQGSATELLSSLLHLKQLVCRVAN